MLDPMRPLPRHTYNALLRLAIKDVTADRSVITLDLLEQLLPPHFEHELPSRPALSRILHTMGWNRVTAASGLAYACPKTIVAIGTVN